MFGNPHASVKRQNALIEENGWNSKERKRTAKWRIKTRESARTYHAFAMYEMDKSIAEMRVVTREVKTWRSRVNATIRRVR